MIGVIWRDLLDSSSGDFPERCIYISVAAEARSSGYSQYKLEESLAELIDHPRGVLNAAMIRRRCAVRGRGLTKPIDMHDDRCFAICVSIEVPCSLDSCYVLYPTPRAR